MRMINRNPQQTSHPLHLAMLPKILHDKLRSRLVVSAHWLNMVVATVANQQSLLSRGWSAAVAEGRRTPCSRC